MRSISSRTAGASARISWRRMISPSTRPSRTRFSDCSRKRSSDRNEASVPGGICSMSCSRWRPISSATSETGTSISFMATRPSMTWPRTSRSMRWSSSRCMFFLMSARRLPTSPSSMPKLLTSSASSSGWRASRTSWTATAKLAALPASASAW